MVNEISGTEMDLTLTEEKMVAWVFEITFEVRVYIQLITTWYYRLQVTQ